MMHWRESLGLDTILESPERRQVELKKVHQMRNYKPPTDFVHFWLRRAPLSGS